ASFENGVSHKDVAQAERVICECGVTAGRTFEVSIAAEFHLPERSASRINNKHIPIAIEGNAIGDHGLRTKLLGGIASRWCHGYQKPSHWPLELLRHRFLPRWNCDEGYRLFRQLRHLQRDRRCH